MPKPILNNRINYQDIIGRVIAHSTFFSQPVKDTSSPTFANLYLSEDLNVKGNLYVEGSSTIFSSEIIEFSDNIILVNNTETNNGVTLQYAGLEVDRGLGENFRIVFNEATNRLETGFLSNLEPVAVLEPTPTNGNLFVWNDTLKRLESSSNIAIPITFGNLASGSHFVLGNGTITDTVGSFYLNGNNLLVGNTQKVYLGSTSESISGDFVGDLRVESSGDIYLTNQFPKRIRVNNQVPIIFSTVDESIYADFQNNLVLSSSQDLFLNPSNGLGGNVQVPYNTRIAFGNTSNAVYSNTLGNLVISSTEVSEDLKFGNSRLLGTTGGLLVDSPAVFIGTGGNVYFGSNSVGNMVIDGTGQLELAGRSVVSGDLSFTDTARIRTDFQISDTAGSTLIHFGTGTTEYQNQKLLISTSDTEAFRAGNFVVNTLSKTTKITDTTASTDVSTGALVVSGGVAIDGLIRVNGTGSTLNGLNVNNQKITNLAEPTTGADAVTKNYVDTLKQGLFVKDSVEAATTVNVATGDLAPGYTVDDYTLADGDRVLVKNQLNGIQNGIYIVTNSGGIRSDDFSIGMSASGFFCFVKDGTINGSLGWICNSPVGDDIVGTDVLTFTQFTGLGQVTNGNGLDKAFNEIFVKIDDFSIGFEPVTTNLRIKSDVIGTGLTGGNGQIISVLPNLTHVNKLGTIDTGVWNGTVVSVPYGGTGISSISSGTIVFGNGTSGILSSDSLYYSTGSLHAPSLTFSEGVVSSTTGGLVVSGNGSLIVNVSSATKLTISTSGTTFSDTVTLGTFGTLWTSFQDNSSSLSIYRGTTSNLQLTNTNVLLDRVLVGNTELRSSSGNLLVSGVTEFKNRDSVTFATSQTLILTNTDGNNLTMNLTNGSTVLTGNKLQLDLPVHLGQDVQWTTGELTVSDSTTLTANGTVYLNGQSFHTVTGWNYAGQLASGGTNVVISGVHSVSVNKNQWTGVFELEHLYNGATVSNVITSIYNDTAGNSHLFFKSNTSGATLQVLQNSGTNVELFPEGSGVTPDGTSSNWDNSWTLVDSTQKDPNKEMHIGSLNSKDLTTESGHFIERDSSDIVAQDTSFFADTLPNQVLLAGDLSLLKLSASANAGDDFYLYCTVQFTSGLLTGTTRKITKYIGAQRIAYLNNPLPSVPQNGDSVELYNKSFVVQYLDVSNQKMTVGYTQTKDPITLLGYADYLVDNLESATVTINSTVNNSIYTDGGLVVSKKLTTDTLELGGNAFFPNNLVLTNTTSGLSITTSSGSALVTFNTSSNINFYDNNLLVSTIQQGNSSIQLSNESINLVSGTSGVSINSVDFLPSGSVVVGNTDNATSSTSGGALTISGGTSVQKDVYIGGDLVVEGSFSSADTLSQPTLTESNLVNCTFDDYTTVYMIKNGTVRNLFFSFVVTPTNPSEYTEVQFTLPERSTNFTFPLDTVSFVNGFVDTTNIIPLMNCISAGVTGTTRLRVKFQSNGTSSHYIQVNCFYNTT